MSYSHRVLTILLAVAINSAPAQQLPVDGITVHGADDEKTAMLDDAVARFAAAGLQLPPLDVRFHDDRDSCSGYGGEFQARGRLAVLHICTARTITIAHELGHAWEHYYATDEAREHFTRHVDQASWNDRKAGWSQRAIEKAAVTIALALSWQWGTTDNPGLVAKLCGYEIITGTPLPDTVPVDCDRGAGSTPIRALAVAGMPRSQGHHIHGR